MYQNIDFLRESHEPYVIITSGDCVYKIDFNKMLEYHINKKADITVGYTKLAAGQDDPTRFGVMQMDTDGRVLGFEEKPVYTAQYDGFNRYLYYQKKIAHWTFGEGEC